MLCLGVVIVLYMGVAFVLVGLVPYNQIDIGNALPAALASIGIRWGRSTGRHWSNYRHDFDFADHCLWTGQNFHGHGQRRSSARGFRPCSPQTSNSGPMHLDYRRSDCSYCRFLSSEHNPGTVQHRDSFAFVLVSIGVIVLRHTQPQLERKFKTPLVPFTPLVTIFFCLYLMLGLTTVTWFRFAIWLGMGLAVYFAYGASHSKLQKGYN